MKVSRRQLLAGSIALAGALGVSTPFTFQQVDAASVPLGQTTWLQTTNNYTYVSARTDPTNTPFVKAFMEESLYAHCFDGREAMEIR